MDIFEIRDAINDKYKNEIDLRDTEGFFLVEQCYGTFTITINFNNFLYSKPMKLGIDKLAYYFYEANAEVLDHLMTYEKRIYFGDTSKSPKISSLNIKTSTKFNSPIIINYSKFLGHLK